MKRVTQQRRSKQFLSRIAVTVGAVALLGFASACSSDSIVSPDVHSSQNGISDLLNGVGGVVNGVGSVVNGVVTTLIPSRALTRNTALPTNIVRSAVIGRSGGTIEIKETGLKLTVPSGAITGNPITITVTAVAGRSVAYEFLPHGTQFAKALQFEQSLDNTSWDKLKLRGVLNGGYFKTLNQIDLTSGLALLDELFPVLVKSNRVSFDIRHFSGYMVSTGRSDDDSDMF